MKEAVLTNDYRTPHHDSLLDLLLAKINSVNIADIKHRSLIKIINKKTLPKREYKL